MSLMVLGIFRHLPVAAGSSANEFVRAFRALAGTFALFGHPHQADPKRVANLCAAGFETRKSQSEIGPSRAALPSPTAMRYAHP